MKKKHLSKLKPLWSSLSDGMNLAESILSSIAFGEKLSPNLVGNRKAQQIFSGFRRYKFIRRVKDGNVDRYTLTSKGEHKFRKIFIDEVVIKKQKKWDGKWRLVIYDLPIRFKKVRDSFRWKLKDLGFYRFQKSAWIYPYPCEGELLFIADFYGVRKHIEILEVNKILSDTKLRSHFSLR